MFRSLLLFVPLALFAAGPAARSDELPADIEKLLKGLQEDESGIEKQAAEEIKKIQEKAEQELKKARDKVIEKLQALQDDYTRAGKLDEALAVRDRIRALKAGVFVGRKCEVLSGNTWYKSEVVQYKDGKYFIKYDGYGDSSNEWVGPERIRFPEAGKKAPAVQKKCEVLWGDRWWAAAVLEAKDGKYYIKYDGYGDNWNEWVGPERIRFPEPNPK